MTFGEKIKKLRISSGISQVELARELGISVRTLQNYETDARTPANLSVYQRFAKHFSVTTDYLLEDITPKQQEKNDCFGFVKVACAVPYTAVGNPQKNAKVIISAAEKAYADGVSIMITPELSVSAASCGDLFFQRQLHRACVYAISEIAAQTAHMDMVLLVGAPIAKGNALYNCAVVLYKGDVVGVIPKENLSTAQRRWFTDGRDILQDSVTIAEKTVPMGKLLFSLSDTCVMGVELGEDLWDYIPKNVAMALQGANLIVNLSAINDIVSRTAHQEAKLAVQSENLSTAYAFCNAGVGESTTDFVYSGTALIYESGKELAKGKRFSADTQITTACIDCEKLEHLRRVRKTAERRTSQQYEMISIPLRPLPQEAFDRELRTHPYIPTEETLLSSRCNEILSLQTAALSKRLRHTHLSKCVVGISGGLDSTLALLVAVNTMKALSLPAENVIGITMPGFGTTDRTYQNALSLMQSLGVTIREISIKEACLQHMKDIGHDPRVKDVTYENTQARERTQILMDVANSEGAILVGTGDLSELAMGWCTYNGDHMSMYGVNASIPKTLMQYMVKTFAVQSENKTKKILLDILDTPVSPELLPPDKDGKIAQKTEDNIGPYELHDFFLYHLIHDGATPEKIEFLALHAFKSKYDVTVIRHWLKTFLRRFFRAQFKRSCMPDGPKVGSVGLGPRGDWSMPSDAESEVWDQYI